VEEVSANAEEMSAQVEEVSASAQSLAEMAANLQRLVAQFRLEEEFGFEGDGAPLWTDGENPLYPNGQSDWVSSDELDEESFEPVNS